VAEAARDTISERDLQQWKLVSDFRQRLGNAARAFGLPPSLTHPERQLLLADYLSLFLFGLLNPVVRTMRALCAASRLQRVQTEICSRPVSLGSFSEIQHVLDPGLLERVFSELVSEVTSQEPPDPRLASRQWMAHDGSLWSALPRMTWALYGAGRNGDSHGVKLHLSFNVLEDKPVRAVVRRGKDCERAVWKEQWQAGDAYIGDRYFGEDYRLLARLKSKECVYVLRLRQEAVIHVEEALPLTDADRRAGVVRQAWVRLGAVARTRSIPVRVVWVEAQGHHLILVTNLGPEELPAELVSLLYRRRWQVELFFRWIKCIFGCRHFLAESQRGAIIQIYLALIAALLLQLYTGRRPSKRMLELIQFYLLGYATLEELTNGLQRYLHQLSKKRS
jgi:hypothetical protein